MELEVKPSDYNCFLHAARESRWKLQVPFWLRKGQEITLKRDGIAKATVVVRECTRESYKRYDKFGRARTVTLQWWALVHDFRIFDDAA